METVNGEWIMKGLRLDDPMRIRTCGELTAWIKKVGFLPLFSGEVEGFSAEEHVSPRFWWTGDREDDPWEWREIIAAEHEVAYGKFFGGRAGFVSREWLPYFANYRRGGYDFDARYEDGLANRREKLIMDRLTDRDEDGEVVFVRKNILSTELKKLCGFGKGGEKNFPGITTGLMMQMYLVTAGFRRRVNKKGGEYGMAVSVLETPESIWGYEHMTSAYGESPEASRKRIAKRIKELFPAADDESIRAVIGK
ncbi:hypothetical protein [Ruminococcus sp.]|uniref:AlkZ-related protein n=1 Tax=Ruminococcus sp. TaxID=41978 RepID=UPI0025FFEF02|nr:hypothetical protein [Ruminococcus sp.]MBQ8966667.1 hypothetical protein [Ruminococcus sp.]